MLINNAQAKIVSMFTKRYFEVMVLGKINFQYLISYHND